MNALELNGLKSVAGLMAVAARTAPKSGGQDWIQSHVASPEEQKAIVEMMQGIGEAKGKSASKESEARGNAIRMDCMSDAKAVGASGLLFLIGVQGRKTVGIDCGGCGFPSCADMLKRAPLSTGEFDFPGPFCIFRVMDLSIAAGSAVKTAMDNNVDNRMMQKVGVAVLKMGLLKPCDLALGIPLSATGKNIYFDRLEKLEARKLVFSKKKD